jgi:hypothetical protein
MPWILFVFTLPWTLTVGYGWVGLMLLIGAAERPRWEEYGLLTAQWCEWVSRPRGASGRPLWRWSTCIGRGIIYQAPRRRVHQSQPLRSTERHERVHVRQVEDLMLLSFIVGTVVALSTSNFLLGAALWWSGGLWQLPNFLTAIVRYGLKWGYRLSEHEKQAYAEGLWAQTPLTVPKSRRAE